MSKKEVLDVLSHSLRHVRQSVLTQDPIPGHNHNSIDETNKVDMETVNMTHDFLAVTLTSVYNCNTEPNK